MAAGLVLALRNADDDDYEALADHYKDNYWIYITGKPGEDDRVAILVPKPFEIGTLFGSIPERGAMAMLKQAKGDMTAREWREFTMKTAELIATGIRGDVRPQFIKPIWEAEWSGSGGYNWFMDRAIIPYYMQQLPAEMQFYPSTPLFAREVGKMTGTSPLKVQHYINGYLGTAGAYMMMTADALIRTGGNYPEMPEEMWWEKRYITGRFIKKESKMSTHYSQDFYEMRQEVYGLVRSVKQAAEMMDMDAVEKILYSEPNLSSRNDFLNSVNQELQNINKQIKFIHYHQTMSASKKAEGLAKLRKRKKELQKLGVTQARTMEEE